jgi:hypothetical protein
LRILSYFSYESERNKDKKKGFLHQVSPTQGQDKILTQTKIQKIIINMKIAEKKIASFLSIWKSTYKQVMNGTIPSQGSKKCRHGKVGEIVANLLFGFCDFEQVGASVDVPQWVARLSKFHHNIEIKTYDIRNRNAILMGDSIRKMKKIKDTLVLIVFFYDGSPSNLVSCEVIKIDENVIPTSTQKAFAKCSAYVKSKTNSIWQTREQTKRVNANHRTRAFYLNNNSNSETDSRQIQLVANLSLLTA